jgi:high-affinity iron transporter
VLATMLLVFREVLEAALIVSIVLAATRGVAARGRWVLGGIALGCTGAIVVALFAGSISAAASGIGQELLNATVLLVAVMMLAWHAIWMARHGRELAAQLQHVGGQISAGARPLTVLLGVVALAVLREGSEVVLFLFGIGAGGSSALSMASGGALGLLAGTAVGAGLYFGLLSIPIRHFFTATNWMILLLAAGMASHAAQFLIQADILPPLGTAVWDSAMLLSDRSLLGQALQTLIGYDARPAGMQLIFYFFTAIFIYTGMTLWGSSPPRTAATATH